MKKYIYNIASILCLGLAVVSCSDYLDVEPEDKLVEEQVYGDETNIKSVLNGVYLELTDGNLYGESLTMSHLEVLAQNFNADDGHDWANVYATYQYDQERVMRKFDAIWSAMYQSILNLNDLIENLEEYKTLDPRKEAIVKGEAYGLRALLHFDLLRLFGPVYMENPEGMAIPYYMKAEAVNGEILAANEVITKVIQDLAMAEELLMNDAINPEGASEIEDHFYAGNRNLRLNYFAVKALQARVHLYAGNTAEANTAAKYVIENGAAEFEWAKPEDILTNDDPDRNFSSEVIFALQNTNLYSISRDLFGESNRDSDILYTRTARINEMYESNINDYRYRSFYELREEKTYPIFVKYEDVEDSRMPFRFMQPMIRISEMYYIAAETETDSQQALNYLNTVRANRGLPELSEGVLVASEITKEYRKEFIGEGQLFYYYKRVNFMQIPNGSSDQTSNTISMGAEQYVVPLPYSEINYQ